RATQAEGAALANEQQANANAAQTEKERDEVKALNENLRATQDQPKRTLYAAHMNLAKHTWDLGGVERVRDLLEQHRPKAGEADLRNFEWYFLYRLCHAEILTLQEGYVGALLSVAYSPDGKRLASGFRNSVKVWDAQTGKELLALKHNGQINSVAFSSDGKRL